MPSAAAAEEDVDLYWLHRWLDVEDGVYPYEQLLLGGERAEVLEVAEILNALESTIAAQDARIAGLVALLAQEHQRRLGWFAADHVFRADEGWVPDKRYDPCEVHTALAAAAETPEEET
ncbi:MAG TPA: hypothetical protein VJB57_07125 [Dehalococcoidia bacterium]|nr:hypothetical protein [Dehalococcoidia bacterium]